MQIPARVRFLSVEPLLKPVDLTAYLGAIDWVIVGGESGPKARPVEPSWVRKIRNDCLSFGVAFFFKQWGGRHSKSGGRLLDEQVWDQFPKDSCATKTLPVSDEEEVPSAGKRTGF